MSRCQEPSNRLIKNCLVYVEMTHEMRRCQEPSNRVIKNSLVYVEMTHETLSRAITTVALLLSKCIDIGIVRLLKEIPGKQGFVVTHCVDPRLANHEQI